MKARVGTALILACWSAAHEVHAQELRVGVGHAGSDHELLGSPLSLGAGLGARATPWLRVRFGVQHAWDDFTSSGSTCVGLVFPGEDCGPELRSEVASITATALSLAFTQSFGPGEIGLVPSLRRMRMRSLQTGATTGRRRQAEKVVYGIGVGLEGQVYLLKRPAIAVHFSATSASHPWFEQELIADGYTPFEDGVQLQWFEVGLTADLGKRLPAP